MNKKTLTLASVVAGALACSATVASLSQDPIRQDPKRGGGALEFSPSTPSDMDLRLTPVVKADQQSADSVVSVYVLNRQELSVAGRARADGLDRPGENARPAIRKLVAIHRRDDGVLGLHRFDRVRDPLGLVLVEHLRQSGLDGAKAA